MSLELQIVKPGVEMVTPVENPDWYQQALRTIEKCGRVSHRSEGRIKEGSAEPFIRKVAIKWGHDSLLENTVFTACFTMSRSASLQHVRHRIGVSHCQASQRYVDMAGEHTRLRVIQPPPLMSYHLDGTVIYRDGENIFYTSPGYDTWRMYDDDALKLWNAALVAYDAYLYLRKECGWKPEDAREALPNETATEIYTTMNIRAWRHYFHMRLDSHAQKPIRALAQELFDYFKKHAPLFVEGLTTHSGDAL